MKLPIHMRLGLSGLPSEEPAPARRSKKARSNRRKRLVQVLCLVCSLQVIIKLILVGRRLTDVVKRICGCFSEGYDTSDRWRRCLRSAAPLASTITLAQVAVMVMAGTAT